MSPLKKVAPSSQWQSGAKGAAPETLALVWDAAEGEYYVASGEDADAWLVWDADAGEYFVSDTQAAPRARIMAVGAATARVIE